MRDQSPSLREPQPLVIRASPVAGMRQYLLTYWARPLAVALGMGVFLAMTGAFQTDEVPLSVRLLYWLPMMVLGLGTALAVNLLVATTLRHRLKLEARPYLDCAIMVTLLTPAVALVAWVYGSLFNGRPPNPSVYIYYLLPSFVINAAMTGLSLLLNRTPVQSHAFAAADSPREIAFLERLPFKYRQSPILALSSEDHYLRVHTEAGETLILMRLYDAVRELEGIEGSQVHRSWWVAKDAVADIGRRDGRASLHLKNGVSVPVSRTYQKALKASGWL